MAEDIKIDLLGDKKYKENLKKDYELIKKAVKEYKNIEKIIKGVVVEIKQDTFIEKEYKDGIIGGSVSYVEVPKYHSLITIDSGKSEYSFKFNGPISGLRKDDDVTVHIYSLEVSVIPFEGKKVAVCLPREPKSGDEVFRLVSEKAGRSFEVEYDGSFKPYVTDVFGHGVPETLENLMKRMAEKIKE